MSAPKEPKVDTDKGYTPLGEFDPFAHVCDYIDGDMDDYSPSEKLNDNDEAYE